MPKRGNWGDWAVIDFPPIEIKKVSCYACSYYYEEDGSCLKTPIIPSKDGNKNSWKTCKHFELGFEYMTYSFMESVKKVKGYDFFNQNVPRVEADYVDDKQDNDVVQKNSSAYYRFIGKNQKIQFYAKTAKSFRNILGFYYGARRYNGKQAASLEKNEEIIEEAVAILPDSLLNAFTSVDINNFSEELSLFFSSNGLTDANPENCIDYCIAIHSIALDLTFSRQSNSKKLNLSIKKAILFLDALTILLFDLNKINDSKYKSIIDKFEQ